MPLAFYVYELRDEHEHVFYVGKGSGRRMYQHLYKARHGQQTHRAAKIRKILAAGGKVFAVIVFRTTDEQEAFAEEKRLIALYGRNNLTNKTDGGDGTSNPTAEVREKIAAARRGYKTSEATRQLQREIKLGKPKSAAHKKSISVALLGNRRAASVEPRSEAYRQKMSTSLKGRIITPEAIEKMRAAKMGHVVTQETREKISQSKKGTVPWNKGMKKIQSR